MSKRSLLTGLLVVVVVVALGGELAGAQKSSTGASANAQIAVSELTKTVLSEIQDIEERVNTIAEDFPAELYNTYRPKGNEEVRTAAEILLHIAQQNESAASAVRTKEQQTAMLAAGK